MNFTLMNQLKDYGFIHPFCANLDKDHCDGSCFPILKDYIQAIGKDFWSLEKNAQSGIVWTATAWDEITVGVGSTPEEACAKLWLALNK